MLPELTIRLKGRYPIEDIDRLVEDVLPLLGLQHPARIQVDLRDLKFLLPSTIAVLAAAINDCLVYGFWADGSGVILPDSRDVRNYLFRMDLIQVALGEQPYEGFRRWAPEGFRECQHFTDEDESHEVARELADSVSERCLMDRPARNAITTCLGELCDNVIHHAESDSGGFAAAQGFPKAKRFELAIYDLGLGIQASLRANPVFAGIDDDVEAINKALELGVTSKPGGRGHAGYGLAVTQALLSTNGGRLLVKSGTGEIWRGAVIENYECDVDLPGTLIIVEARTNRALNVRDVYQALLGELQDDD